jgi:hypothetical protein
MPQRNSLVASEKPENCLCSISYLLHFGPDTIPPVFGAGTPLEGPDRFWAKSPKDFVDIQFSPIQEGWDRGQADSILSKE